MIQGSVLPIGDAVAPVRLRNSQGAIVEFQTVVDTGFNDWLVLSRADIQRMKLPFREEGRFTLADGSESVSRLFVAEVEWFGRWRRVLVVEMDGGPLLEMAMLRGSHLAIDVVGSGRVEITQLIK